MARYTSTREPLEANEEYVSDILNVDGGSSIRGIVTSDVAGSLYIEHSLDGDTWYQDESWTIDPNGIAFVDSRSYGPLVRFKYINGSSNQDSFTLAIRVNESRSFSEGGGDAPVTSVNGKDGDVVLAANDVGAASLVGGKIPSSQIPDVAITATHSVANRSAMLALDVQTNDIAIVAQDEDGESRTYVLVGASPSVFADWVELASPGSVTSVNGEVGVVTLGAADVGAASATHTHTAAQISNATAVGRNVLVAVDAAAARTAIGAGTSSYTGSDAVKLTGNQTIAGIKTFSSPPVVPAAVNPNEAATKAQLDAALSPAQRMAIDALDAGTSTVADIINALQAS